MLACLDPRFSYLIVNADDLGFSPGVNRAIFQAHDEGIVTSASLRPLMPPASLISLIARHAARSVEMPNVACAPVIDA